MEKEEEERISQIVQKFSTNTLAFKLELDGMFSLLNTFFDTNFLLTSATYDSFLELLRYSTTTTEGEAIITVEVEKPGFKVDLHFIDVNKIGTMKKHKILTQILFIMTKFTSRERMGKINIFVDEDK